MSSAALDLAAERYGVPILGRKGDLYHYGDDWALTKDGVVIAVGFYHDKTWSFLADAIRHAGVPYTEVEAHTWKLVKLNANGEAKLPQQEAV